VRALAAAAALLAAIGCSASPQARTTSGEGRPAAGAESAPSRQPVVVDDLYELGYVSELEIAPDGKSAVYVWTRQDRAKDAARTRLHRLELDATTAAGEALTPETVDASDVSFSPDGRFLAWLEADDDSTALRWAPVTARGIGKAKTSLDLKSGLSSYEWSPDGERFVVVRKDAKPKSAKSSDPHVVTRTQARADGSGFLDERRRHLWIVAREGADGGKSARQITTGPYDDGDPAWSPDGRTIAFVSNRSADPDATDNTDIYFISPEGGDAVAKVTLLGADSDPSWSHRGDRLAFLSVRRPDDYYQPSRILALTLEGGGAPVDLTGSLDAWVAGDSLSAGESPPAPLWSDDDGRFLALFERQGANWIGEVDSRTGAARELRGGRFVYGLLRELPRGGLLFSRTDPTHPPELFVLDAGAAEPRQITRFYDRFLAKKKLSTPEKIVATNSAGDSVEAWLYPPLDPSSSSAVAAKHPLVVYIHGGPQGFDGDYFDFDLENQLFPAAGWGVLRVNYRGSTSYGEKFSRAIWGDWHSREFEDLMVALDRAIATHPWIDADRLGIGGWSYGGIMTLWTVGHTDRFKVGVPERLGFDYLSSFGEDQWFVWYLSELGEPGENADLYRRLSPGTYVRNIKTPLYIIANENDYNCPLPQALQLYQRLKLQGQKTELVVYPDESHSMSAPSHLTDRLRRLLVWFGRHLGN
jgi:dipeptidyl aminopeptidase/acylaminoacyl peptidase